MIVPLDEFRHTMSQISCLGRSASPAVFLAAVTHAARETKKDSCVEGHSYGSSRIHIHTTLDLARSANRGALKNAQQLDPSTQNGTKPSDLEEKHYEEDFTLCYIVFRFLQVSVTTCVNSESKPLKVRSATRNP